MPDDTQQKRLKQVIILFLACSIILVIFGILTVKTNKSGKSVDKDTGEVIYNDKGTTIEKQSGGGEVVLLGASAIIDNGATQDQYLLIRKLIQGYGDNKLNKAFDRLAILPKSTNEDNGVISSELRLGNTETKLKLTVKLVDLKQVQVTIIDQNGKYPSYDSGLQNVIPNSATNPNDAEVDAGDGGAPQAPN